ncbi:hypothetical protein [Candidatus Poriferisodalis sp.]|uniref:hypothetical protein n=1 Tax=Candidatus Poriferisodalis sp. TaxID=3101277 RepID=UPI003C6F1480
MAARRHGKPRRKPDSSELIPAAPKNIARALMSRPPFKPDEWRYTDRKSIDDKDRNSALRGMPADRPLRGSR